MKNLILLMLLSIMVFTVSAQTAKQDSIHKAYHMKLKKDPKQNNPYTYADSAKVKKATTKQKKKAN